MVTAETAMVLPLLVVVTALAMAVLAHGIDQVRCVDAARSAARAAARGDSVEAVRSAARSGAPPGSAVTVSPAGETVVVEVTAPGRAAWLPGLPPPSGRAVADREFVPAAVGGDPGERDVHPRASGRR